MLISTQTTAPAPSVMVGIPLKRGLPLPDEPLMHTAPVEVNKEPLHAVRWATGRNVGLGRHSKQAVGLSHIPRSGKQPKTRRGHNGQDRDVAAGIIPERGIATTKMAPSPPDNAVHMLESNCLNEELSWETHPYSALAR